MGTEPAAACRGILCEAVWTFLFEADSWCESIPLQATQRCHTAGASRLHRLPVAAGLGESHRHASALQQITAATRNTYASCSKADIKGSSWQLICPM